MASPHFLRLPGLDINLALVTTIDYRHGLANVSMGDGAVVGLDSQQTTVLQEAVRRLIAQETNT